MVNVVVWGLGNHAQNRILPVLSVMDEIRLIGVCSRNIDVVNKCAKRWSCFGWNDPKQMLNNPNVDVVYLATPIGVHFSLAKQALQAGKHGWSEKPLTCNLEESQELVLIAELKGKVLAESFMYLHHPQFQRIKKFVDESREVKSIVCRFGIPALDEPGFRNDPKLGGGALWDVGTYTTSALVSLFPEEEIDVLFSEVLFKIGELVDSEGRALLRFSNGVTAYVEWAVGVAYKNEIDLWTKDGSFFTDKIFSKPKEYRVQYQIRDVNGNERLENEVQSEQFLDMFSYFLKLIGNNEKAILEREIIIQRAKLMNDIVHFNFNGVDDENLDEC